MSVKVYTLPSCVQCDSTKRMLKKNSIEFEEVDMSEDPIALEMVKSRSEEHTSELQSH